MMTNNREPEWQDKVINIISDSPCVMHFQPIIESSSNEIFGFEALFRGFKYRPTSNFQDIFTQKKCGRELWEVDMACVASALRQGRELAKRHRLFINVHVFTIRKLAENKCAILMFMKALGIAPGSIVLEISEDTAFANVSNLIEDMQELRAAGIHVAIDDVKTNFKWFQHMSALAPTYLKIDRSCISEIAVMNERQFFVESICLLTQELGLHVIAVGVESEDTARVIKSLGVSFMQGFLQGRPHTAEAWYAADSAKRGAWAAADP